MNDGYGEISYGAPLEAKRVRYKTEQGVGQTIGEALVLKSTDNISALSPKYKGNTTSTVERCDLVLPMPLTMQRSGQSHMPGALLVQVPDGTISGGNMRGYGAVDLQATRTSPTQVASGAYSIVIGSNNSAANPYSIALGDSNIAGNYGQTYRGIALGYNNQATGSGAIAIGSNNISSGTNTTSTALGNSNTASGSGSVALGYGNIASGEYSMATGYQADVRGMWGKRTHGYSAYTGEVALACTVSSAAQASLGADSSTAQVSGNQMVIPSNGAYTFDGLVIARQQASQGTAAAAWKFEGLAIKESTNATVQLIAYTVTPISNTPGWGFDLAANTTLGSITFLFTGAAATNVRCSATVRSVEIVYA